ncbi:unnamed protein product [Lymnaea stagnalis]|uniref:carbonic anhydrase n=1 Tax=Lymnaea stagnalis TaxID=6523 RepID=A0AAV2HD69_LYMST
MEFFVDFSRVFTSKLQCYGILAGFTLTAAAKWSYDGDHGPMNWHKLFPEQCGGKFQSPIDLRAEETSYNPDLKDFAIWYDPPKPDSKFYVKNNGHTAQVDLDGDFYVTNGGLPNIYKILQFHFHWGHKAHHGSEHLIDGKASPIELHMVSYNSELYTDVGGAVTKSGGLAVLGVMYELSEEDNPTLEIVIKGLKHIKKPGSRILLPQFSLRDLLPSDITRYYRYNGSLTTPACFESVIWTVFDTPQTISEKQLKEFRNIQQMKHKKDGRHRRSSSKVDPRMEELMEEMGILGNKEEVTAFKASVLLDMQKELDIPHQDQPMPTRSDHGANYKPKFDEERASQIDKNMNEGGGNSVEKEHSTAPASSENSAESDGHEVMVNNYRPVQPLNDRVVHRSFKLRGTRVTDVNGAGSGAHWNTEGTHEAQREGRGSSNQNVISLAAILCFFIAWRFV